MAMPAGTDTATACGVALTWDAIDAKLHTTTYAGQYNHDDTELQAYIDNFCKGWTPPDKTQAQFTNIGSWVSANPLVAGGVAALVILVFVAGKK